MEKKTTSLSQPAAEAHKMWTNSNHYDMDGGSEHINLKVTGQDGSVVHFKIKKNTMLRKLMSAYCERTGVKMGSMRFRFDGQPIGEDDTPSILDMEDGDAIDVFQQQTGGGGMIH